MSVQPFRALKLQSFRRLEGGASKCRQIRSDLNATGGALLLRNALRSAFKFASCQFPLTPFSVHNVVSLGGDDTGATGAPTRHSVVLNRFGASPRSSPDRIADSDIESVKLI
jgi:hypothetical protein